MCEWKLQRGCRQRNGKLGAQSFHGRHFPDNVVGCRSVVVIPRPLATNTCRQDSGVIGAANDDGARVCLEVQAKLDDLAASSEAFADVPWLSGLGLAVQAAVGCGEVETG